MWGARLVEIPELVRVESQPIVQFERIELAQAGSELRFVGQAAGGQQVVEVAFAKLVGARSHVRGARQAIGGAAAGIPGAQRSRRRMVECGGLGGDLLGGRGFAAMGDIGLGQRGAGNCLAGATGYRNGDVGAENVFLATAFARHVNADGRVRQAVVAGAPGDDLCALGFAACDAEFVAVFEYRFQPFAFAAGYGLRFGDAGRFDQRQAGKAAAQVFAGRSLARPRLRQLRFGLRQRAFSLDGFEAGGIAELLAALDGFGLPFEQR